MMSRTKMWAILGLCFSLIALMWLLRGPGGVVSAADMADGVAAGGQSLDRVAVLQMPAVDNAALIAEDQANYGPGVAPRFALPLAVQVTPATHGTWETLTDGSRLWRLRVSSPGALSLNLGFTRYKMPANARLLLYTPDYRTVRGPFTAADNELHGEFWSPILLGDEIVIQLTLPAAELDGLNLELTSVNHGYAEIGDTARFLSGACNVDVICAEGDLWRDEIRSVAVISTGGSTFCTGFLVNNTAQDLTPYFMTARHCGINSGNAASLVVYWNYENSWCRPVDDPINGQPGDGNLDQFQTGSYWRSSYSPSDFTLVELDDFPNPAFNVHWAGWDATPADATSATAIHHPNTDEKRISFEFDPTTTTSYLGNSSPGDGTHVRVEDWDVGTTEPGSSGSPLFNQDHRIVGQLHGGYAACYNDDPDWYGRVSVSWTGGGSDTTRLVDWLDPTGSGDLVLDGRDLIEGPDFNLAATPEVLNICVGSNALYTVNVGQENNYAYPVTLSVSGQPGGTTPYFSVNPVVPPGSSQMAIMNTGGAAAGNYALEIMGMGPTSTHTTTVGLNVNNSAPGNATLIAPYGVDAPLVPTFQWSAANQGATYLLIVKNVTSGQLLYAVTQETSYTFPTPLDPLNIYFWSVRAYNPCGAGTFVQPLFFRTQDIPPILLVDDDDNSPNVQSTYTAALDALGLQYDLWDTNNSDNEPTAATLLAYDVVIWFTGDEFGGFAGPGTAGETALATYLDGGKCLFISSQDYVWDRGVTGFMQNYLGVASATSDVSQSTVTGAGTVYGGLGPYTLQYPFTNYSDRLTPGAGAETAFNGNAGSAAVDKDSGAYKTTFWGFPWEALPGAATRQQLMSTTLNWCSSE